MATTITGSPHAAGGLTARVAMDGTAGNCEAVTLPGWARRVCVAFRDSGGSGTTGQISRGQTETDGAAISANAYQIESGAHIEMTLRPGRSAGAVTLYLACGGNSGFAYLMIEG